MVPRLMKRCKTPDYGDRAVFGVPLSVSQQRHGQPLPQCVLYAMRRLRRAAADAVGVFRKSGVRSRVTALRQQLEVDPGECRHLVAERQPVQSSLLRCQSKSKQSVITAIMSDVLLRLSNSASLH